MTITFENESDVIAYAFEKILSDARRNQQIFVAQCVWWLASIIGLEQGLINYIDNIQSRIEVTVTSDKALYISVATSEPFDKEQSDKRKSISPVPRDIQEESRQYQVLEVCEEYLKESRRLREIVALKSKGTTQTGQVNPTGISKRTLRKGNKPVGKQATSTKKSLTGIDGAEITRRRKAGECLNCTWPADRRGIHRVQDCYRPIKLDKGTAYFSNKGKSQKTKNRHESIKNSSEDISGASSSNDELERNSIYGRTPVRT